MSESNDSGAGGARTTDPPNSSSTTPPAVSANGASMGALRSAQPGSPVPAAGPRPPSAGQQPRQLPAWIAIIGGIVLLVVVFVGAFLADRTGTSSGVRSIDLQQTTINVIREVDPSIVQVQGHRNGPGGSVGSGEILTSDGYIVTNSHVIHGFTSFGVLLSTGQTVQARLIGDVPQQDLAVLKINATNLKPIAVGDSSSVEVGQFVVALGSPLGLEQSATSGIVSALNREGREVVDGNTYTLTGMIQTSAPINPGNSGGALVDTQGKLIGIPTLSAVDPSTEVAANGIGFAIASNKMEKVIAPFVPSIS
jgi:S1-C subfamily serine protease